MPTKTMTDWFRGWWKPTRCSFPYPIGSVYGIFTYICHKQYMKINYINVGRYTIHGSYGYHQSVFSIRNGWERKQKISRRFADGFDSQKFQDLCGASNFGRSSLAFASGKFFRRFWVAIFGRFRIWRGWWWLVDWCVTWRFVFFW